MLVGHLVNKMPGAHLRKSDPTLVDSDTLLGVEIEVEHANRSIDLRAKEAGYWSPKDDNSLRNRGKEFVFSEPLFGADVISALSFFCEQAKKNNYAISERTGLHVHVDVRGMDVEKFKNMVVLYFLLEKLIYHWVGDDREGNIHCLPWYSADADLENIALFIRYGDDTESATRVIKGIHRYSGFNLNSLAVFGTVEFRQLKTTFDFNRIVDWINILLTLKKQAIAWQGTPETLILESRILGAYGFVNRVFGPELTGKLWYPGFSKDIIGYGATLANQLVRVAGWSKSKKSLEEVFNSHYLKDEATDEETGENSGYSRYLKKQASKEAGKIIKTPAKKKMPEPVPFSPNWFLQQQNQPQQPFQPPPQNWVNSLTVGNFDELQEDNG